MEIFSRTELHSESWRVSGEVTLKNIGFFTQGQTCASSLQMEVGQKHNSLQGGAGSK